jgi:hypothetical protein
MTRRSGLVGVGFLLLGCGGPPAPESPADEPVTAESGAAAASEPAEPAPSAESGPASAEDVNAILQLVVNDEELDKFLHLGEPGRFPLKVAGEGVPSELKIVKSTEPVQVVDGPKSKKDAVLVFTAIEVENAKASVRYQYDIEGIRGTATLAKGPHGWELLSSRIVER